MKIKSSLKVGKIFGIPLQLHYTWFFIFVLITASLVAYLPTPEPYILWQRIVLGVVASLLLFLCIIAHELAHSLVAIKNNMPVKGITLFVFGGVSQITKEANRPSIETLVAIVGPLSSVVIAGIFLGAYLLLRGIDDLLATVVQWLAFVNILMAMFNLIPGFPLDGGRVFRSILWMSTGSYIRATRIATFTARVIGYIFIIGGIIFMFVSRQWIGGLWLAFIGWFLETAATVSYRQALMRDVLQSLTVRDVMTAELPLIRRDISLERLVQAHILHTGLESFIVAVEGRLDGIVTLQDIKKVPRERWQTTLVAEIMASSDKLKIAYPNQDALSLFEQMDEGNIAQVPVVEGASIIGIVDRCSLVNLIRIRNELRA